MTTLNLPVAEPRPPRSHPRLVGDLPRTATGSTPESRLTDLLARLADADAIGASRIRAWDRLQERRTR